MQRVVISAQPLISQPAPFHPRHRARAGGAAGGVELAAAFARDFPPSKGPGGLMIPPVPGETSLCLEAGRFAVICCGQICCDLLRADLL